jgi:hypothetical protein
MALRKPAGALTRIPILLGAGRPLFGALTTDVQLEHIATRTYPFGFVQSTYRVPRPGNGG